MSMAGVSALFLRKERGKRGPRCPTYRFLITAGLALPALMSSDRMACKFVTVLTMVCSSRGPVAVPFLAQGMENECVNKWLTMRVVHSSMHARK